MAAIETTPAGAEQRRIFTVSVLNRTVRGLLEDVFDQVWVEGEISNLRRISSGHWYFTLKDQQAQLSCAMFRGQNRRLRFSPEDGMQLLVRGRVGLYEARGTYQLIVEHMEQGGEGALLRAFQALKDKLDSEGLFDPAHKRELPELPRRIGVITSPGGAALRDVLSVLARRFPGIPVLLYPSAVQGDNAPRQLTDALNLAIRRDECDVLLLTRGGGSLEDLSAFNDETLARAIHACPIPVVSAVGHEIDFTIADFVADRRAATPSAAAELLSPDQRDWLAQLDAAQQRLSAAIARRLGAHAQRLDGIGERLHRGRPGRRIEASYQRLDEFSERIERSIRHLLQRRHDAIAAQHARLLVGNPQHRLQQLRNHGEQLSQRLRDCIELGLQARRHRLERSLTTLNAVSPLATLERGYAIITGPDQRVVHQAQQLSVGDRVKARVASGELDLLVEDVRKRAPG